MNMTAKLALTGLAGPFIGALIVWQYLSHHKTALAPTCANVALAEWYGVRLSESSAPTTAGIGAMDLPPGGYKHNIAINLDPMNGDANDTAQVYDLTPCDDSSGTPKMTMQLSNQTVGEIDFNSKLNDTSATFGLVVKQSNSSTVPNMSGYAYAMQ